MIYLSRRKILIGHYIVQIELIRLAKQLNPQLLVSTSGMGNGRYDESLAREADFILPHFNNT